MVTYFQITGNDKIYGTTQLLFKNCYGKQLSWRVYEAISRPLPVMNSKAKPSPCRIGDCFGSKERSLAMTAMLSNYKFTRMATSLC
jgi:hypothetical protein